MRPQGEIRKALADAAEQLVAERGPVSWREMAEAAQVGYLAAARTADNMRRAGALVVAGYEKRPHSRRRVTLYEPAPAGPLFAAPATACVADLTRVVSGWTLR